MFPGRAHARCMPFRGSSFVGFCERYFFRNMRNRGIAMIRPGFERRKCLGSKSPRNDNKCRHTVEFLENIFKSSPYLKTVCGWISRSKNETGHSGATNVPRLARLRVPTNDLNSSWPQCCCMDSECPVSTVSCFFKEFAYWRYSMCRNMLNVQGFAYKQPSCCMSRIFRNRL